MNQNPLLSVVMPVFNRKDFVEDAITSILAQTFTDFEFIIVDDGSSDSSLEIIQTYAQTDPRIKIVCHQQNLGIARARNTGIDKAQGEYIAFMDSDDISMPDRFEKQIDFLDTHPEISAVGTQCEYIGDEHEKFEALHAPLSPPEIWWSLISKSTLINASMMARREIFTVHGFRHNDLKAASDYDFWSRVSSKVLIANLPEALIQFRNHPDRISRNYRTNQQTNAYEIIRKRVKQMTGIELTDDQIQGLRYPAKIKNVHDASTLSKVSIRLLREAMNWSDTKEDQEKIEQMAAGGLRKIAKSQGYNIRLLPFVLYSFFLSPKTLLYLDPRKR